MLTEQIHIKEGNFGEWLGIEKKPYCGIPIGWSAPSRNFGSGSSGGSKDSLSAAPRRESVNTSVIAIRFNILAVAKYRPI
jgi:hypothetical protein